MKRIITFFLLFSLTINITACSNKGSNNQETLPSTQKEAQATKTSEKETETTKIQEKTLSDIETFLQKKGVLLGDKMQMAAEMVGAIDGFKYADCKTEIYEFDINSEEYKKLSNGEEIPLKGMEGFFVKAISANGKFVLIGDPSQEIIDAFESFE